MNKIVEFDIKRRAVSNIDKVLSSLRLDNIKDSHSVITGCCPIHHGDNTSAFCLYKDTGRWICFTRSCHGSTQSSDIIDLVCKVKKINRSDAIEFLNKILGHTDINLDECNFAIASTFFSNKQNDIVSEEKIYTQEYFDKRFGDTNDFYRQRGYQEATLNYFGVKYCASITDRFYNRMIIPIHNSNGKIIGWTGRHVGDITEQDKFIHTTGLHKTKILYNWHRAEKYFKSGRIFIVESPGAVWGLHQIGVYNAVAILGCFLSEYQAKMITQHPYITNTVVCLDADDAGQNGMIGKKSSLHLLENKVNIETMHLPMGQDLDNISKTDFELCFSRRQNFIKKKVII